MAIHPQPIAILTIDDGSVLFERCHDHTLFSKGASTMMKNGFSV
jgi:hypothetical protein